MSDATPTPLRDPILRFRVRSLLWLTTGVAILTTILTPFYRRQSPVVQKSLLITWTLMSIFTAIGLWWSRRSLWQRSADNGATDFLLWSAPQWRLGLLSGARGNFTFGILWIIYCVVASFGAVKDADFKSKQPGWHASLVFTGCFTGLLLAAGFSTLLPTPIRFHEKGVSLAKHTIPWHFIRSAKWIRPGVIRLHRLDGDLFVSVPSESRPAFEAYLHEKTKLVDGATGQDITSGQ